MDYTIFYSWQSDLPGSVNRNFILDALERAVKTLRQDETLQVVPRVDRDTAGVAGAPDIVQTILVKIEQAQVFVCDVSIINSDASDRKTPNPNVLIELGYAMGKLGLSRIIMVMNTAYGGPDELPFDLRTKRQMTYALAKNEEKAAIRETLVRNLTEALRIVLVETNLGEAASQAKLPSIADQLLAAIVNGQSNQVAIARRFMQSFVERLSETAPDFSQTGERDDILMHSLEQSIPLVVEFTKLVEIIAEYNAESVAHTIYKGFELLLAKYNLPPGFSGSFRDTDFDYYKFIGHEIFVIFFSFLIRDDKWDLIAELLDESMLIISTYRSSDDPVSFQYISQPVELLDLRNRRLKSGRITYHGDIINQRHTDGELGALVPIQQFAEADYFLYLRDQIGQDEEDPGIQWLAWSVLYMRQQPRFIVEAVRVKKAQQLLRPLNVTDIATLRGRLEQRAGRIQQLFRSGFWRNSLSSFDWSTIGSK